MSTVTPLSENIKYLVVGIDNQSGSLTYILGDDKKYIDSATKDISPYNVLQNVAQTPQENMQYVRVKVQKSATRPITASTDTRPYFELNQNWYTLLLDEHVTPLETSGVIDKNWFGDYGLTQDPFSFFNRRIYNKELIVQNIKYLFNLPPGESNFNEKFPEVEASKTAATLKEIQDSLVRPFFAIKTVLDMQARDNTLPKDAPPYFVNGRDRYGYPNIMGDKSHIISALQLLYDVRLYCPECIKDNTSGTLKQLLNHITYRNYFLHKDDVTENIMDFETALQNAGIVTSTTAVVPGTVGATSSSIDSCWKFLKDYLDIGKVGIPDGAGIPARPSDKNIVLIRSKEVIPKVENFELIGQICQLKEMDHFIYFNYKLGMMFDDVEIRESRDRLQYIEEDKISLYRKKGRTYRDFLQTKYLLKNEDIDETLKFNKTIKFVDQFITNDPLRDGEKITEFMKQHLSLQSRRDLAATLFTGNKSRHGLCNNSGDLSYFIAAIEMIYDCVPFNYGQNFNANVFGPKASMKKFEFMLLNTEYCLRRLFELIQTTIDPLTTMTTKQVSTDPKENVYFNYLICVNFLLNNLNPIINLRFPTGTTDKLGARFPEYEFTTIMNNYYYKTIGSIFLDYEKTKAESFEAAFSEDPENTQSTKWYPGKLLDVLAKSSAGIGGPREIIEEQITEKTRTMKIIEREEKATKLLLDELKKKHYITPALLPNILQDKCVETIHKLILVLSRKFNVFIDFEDDLRSLEKKMEHFKDASGKKQPNFIIKIGSLPQKPLTTAAATPASTPVSTGTSAASTPVAPTPAPPGTSLSASKNWLKITGFSDEISRNADYTNGIYAPIPDSESYKHIDHNNVTIRKNGSKWEIVITSEATPPVDIVIASESDTAGTWNVKNTLYSDTDTGKTSITSVKLEEIGEPYLPGPGDPLPDFIPTTSVLPPEYTIDGKPYERIGTIYKSLHHDMYYKYYNEKVQTLVFDFKATNLSNPAAQLALNTKDMFPFIGLYRRTDYMTVIPKTRTVFIYQDVVQFIDTLKGQLYV